jgi:glycerol uptake facilitator-like aquaporin
MDSRLRGYFAEALGTFVLVFFGACAVCVQELTVWPPLGVGAVALAEGLALGVVLTATWQVSQGGLNPAITLTLWVFRKLDNARALALVVAQAAGAVVAGLAVRLLFTEDVLVKTRLGTPFLTGALVGAGAPPTTAALLTGLGLEALFTALIVVALFATLLDPRGPKLGGFGVGLAQVAVVAVGFRLTGGAANPARWLGPAVWQRTVPSLWAIGPLSDHAVYWAGPTVGALVAGLLYSSLILPPEKR